MMDQFPEAGTKTARLLEDLLNGEQVTVIDAMYRYNLMTPNARASELRKMGWPIRSLKVAHPTLPDEEMVAYYMEVGFRAWWAEEWYRLGAKAHPANYPENSGRGHFGHTEGYTSL